LHLGHFVLKDKQTKISFLLKIPTYTIYMPKTSTFYHTQLA
jgi:hypothetical protein